MTTLSIEGQKVKVSDDFLSLSQNSRKRRLRKSPPA